MANTDFAIHAEGHNIEFEYGGKDRGFENFSFTISNDPVDPEAYSAQEVTVFIGVRQREQVATGLRKLADEIHPARKAKS
jgi:hypothetical protein